MPHPEPCHKRFDKSNSYGKPNLNCKEHWNGNLKWQYADKEVGDQRICLLVRQGGRISRAAYHFINGHRRVTVDQLPEVGFSLAWESCRVAFHLIEGAYGSRAWCDRCVNESPVVAQ